MFRVVLDPGVLIAALFSPRGAPARLVSAWQDGRFEMVVSPALLVELARVLMRPRFGRYVTEEDTQESLNLLVRQGLASSDPEPEGRVSPDPGDDYLVWLARSAGADYLISGDSHLLRLKAPNPPVLAPRAFLALVEAR